LSVREYETYRGIYESVGARHVINARGAYTTMGGSRLSPTVSAAMAEANRYFVDMRELLESSGRIIAQMLECEAAYVTSGAAGALALAAAACLTGDDPAKMERLPDVTGMRHEILIQKDLRVRYDRAVTVPGAKLVEVGDEAGTTPQQLEAAIGPRPAAVHYYATSYPNLSDRPGTLMLDQVVAVARAHAVPVIVDAAGQTYPLDSLKKYAQMGADLVCYAGKYFDAPHSTGVLTGRKDLVEIAAMQGFIGFETSGYRTFGRAMKLDRQEIVAVVVALREWFAMNHEERFLGYARRAERITAVLRGIPGIAVTPVPIGPPVMRSGLQIALEPGSGKTGPQIAAALREGTPSIAINAQPDTLTVSVAFFEDGEEEIVAERLRDALI